MAGGILKKIVYSTGTKIRVSIVAKSNPNIIVTAMETKKASCRRGIMPRIVVNAAIITGRIRLTPESTTAQYFCLLSPITVSHMISISGCLTALNLFLYLSSGLSHMKRAAAIAPHYEIGNKIYPSNFGIRPRAKGNLIRMESHSKIKARSLPSSAFDHTIEPKQY